MRKENQKHKMIRLKIRFANGTEIYWFPKGGCLETMSCCLADNQIYIRKEDMPVIKSQKIMEVSTHSWKEFVAQPKILSLIQNSLFCSARGRIIGVTMKKFTNNLIRIKKTYIRGPLLCNFEADMFAIHPEM